MFHLLSLMHLPKYLKLAMVLSFPGFFTRLNIPIPSPVLQAAMLPHCYRLNQPVLMHTIHSLPLSSHSLFSSSLSSPPAIWIYFSVFPGLAPGLRGFSDHSYFWEAFQAGGRKSRQRWTVPCHLNWTPVTWAFPSPSPLKVTLGRLRGWEDRGKRGPSLAGEKGFSKQAKMK